MRVVASSLESSEEARSLWGADPALVQLAQLPGVDVLHGVDATALERSELRGEAFDAVAFTFPHSGKKGRIQLNKSLLASFALSLQKAALLRDHGHAEVTLAAGQGGTPADGSKRRSSPGDSWQLALNVAEGGFLVTATEPFHHDGWTALGYRASGHYRGLGRGTMDKQFRSTEGVVHCLLPEGRPGAVSRWAEVFELDASFWVADDAWRAALAAHLQGDTADGPDVVQAFTHAVCDLSRRAVGQHLSSVALVNLWQRPADGRLSACLRFTYAAPELAMTHARALTMHEAVKECLQRHMRVTVRTRADVV